MSGRSRFSISNGGCLSSLSNGGLSDSAPGTLTATAAGSWGWGDDSVRSVETFISTFVRLCFLLCYDNFLVLLVNEQVPCFRPFCLGKHHEDVHCIRDGLTIIFVDTITEIVGNCDSRSFYRVDVDKIENRLEAVGDQI
ncbi:hypothetical protein MHU86_14421 [Fragilaria crotonensis]|nr:hypothetical protein MHU86_14421 [Fragilaria crotonensis]